MIKLKHLLESEDSKHAAGIAYIVDDELLCVKSMSGKWGIPKGHRHVDETPEEGARREFTEETQIILSQPIKLSHIAKKKNGGDFHVFICKGDKKINAHINHEHTDWGYFRLFDLPEPFDYRVEEITDTLFENIIMERIDFLDTAERLIKHYKLKSKVKEFNIEKNILFLGYKEDTESILCNSHFFIHTPIGPDPFPTVLFEAIQSRTPIIFTATGGSIEILDQSKNGLLIDYKDLKKSTQLILNYINDLSLQNNNVKDSIKFVSKNYNKEIFSKKITSLISTF